MSVLDLKLPDPAIDPWAYNVALREHVERLVSDYAAMVLTPVRKESTAQLMERKSLRAQIEAQQQVESYARECAKLLNYMYPTYVYGMDGTLIAGPGDPNPFTPKQPATES